MTALNLLPWRDRRRQRRRQVFVVGLALSFVAAAVVVGVAWRVTENALEGVREENAGLAERRTALDSRLLELAEIERSNAQTARRIGVLQRLEAERLDTVRILDELARTLPPGLRYTTVARRGGVVLVRGTADAESGVSAYMRNLAGSAWFGAPSLQNIAETADPGGPATFDLSFETATVADDDAAREQAHARE